MAGQIIKRGERNFVVRIYMGRDDEGKRRYLNHSVKGTRKDAQKYLNNSLRDKDLGVFVEPASTTINAYLDKWLSSVVRARVREATFDDYKYLLNRFVRPAFGNHKLSDVRPLDVQRLYGFMTNDKGLSARSVRMVHAVLSSAMKQAVKWNMLARNPCDSAELPRMVRREMQGLSTEGASRFLEAAKDDKHGIVLAFALATGMRPEEYLALKWLDVDLQTGTATVRRTLVWRKGGGWYFREPN